MNHSMLLYANIVFKRCISSGIRTHELLHVGQATELSIRWQCVYTSPAKTPCEYVQSLYGMKYNQLLYFVLRCKIISLSDLIIYKAKYNACCKVLCKSFLRNRRYIILKNLVLGQINLIMNVRQKKTTQI